MGNGKIGIFAPNQHGDMGLVTCVLKYKDILWPGKDIVWFASLEPHMSTYLDMLKYNDAISEIREWGQFKSVEDWKDCIDSNGHLKPSRQGDFESMKDLERGYFPAPWAVLPSPKWEGVNYANIPRMVCGADPSWEWHPYLGFSDQEREMVRDFHAALPHQKTVMLETNMKSAGDINLDDGVVREIMRMCRQKFGKCNFIFASKIDHTKYVDDVGVVSASQFTVRQTALIHNHCNFFIGISSGISVATYCWGNKPIPRVEFCGTPISYSLMANGPVTTVICDDLAPEEKSRRMISAVWNALHKF